MVIRDASFLINLKKEDFNFFSVFYTRIKQIIFVWKIVSLVNFAYAYNKLLYLLFTLINTSVFTGGDAIKVSNYVTIITIIVVRINSSPYEPKL